MTRYQFLRSVGCNVFSAALIAFANALRGVPDGLVVFMHIKMEYEK